MRNFDMKTQSLHQDMAEYKREKADVGGTTDTRLQTQKFALPLDYRTTNLMPRNCPDYLTYRGQVQFVNGVREAVREDSGGDVVIVGICKGRLPCEHLEEDGAEGEDVVGGLGANAVAGRHLLLLLLLGRHLSAALTLEHLWAAVGGVVFACGVVDEGELDAALEEDVVRGEAAVDDAARVRVPQRGAQLPRHLHLVIHGHLPGREGG